MKITAPHDSQLTDLCQRLADLGSELEIHGNWPQQQLQLCGEYGVYEWFLDPSWGGQAWSEADVVRGYLALSAACLTTTFIITQRTGASRRLAGGQNQLLKESLLPDLAAGALFATVGISHLTTSRRHLKRPVLSAQRSSGGFLLDGYSPWVTGAKFAQHIVVGATLLEHDQPTDQQLLISLPTDLPGVTIPPAANLVGLTASHTGPVQIDRVEIADSCVLAGPVEDVMSSGIGATTGGHETSTLALGLAAAALEFLTHEADRRADLQAATDALRSEHETLVDELLAIATGRPASSKETLRQRANSLVLRLTQAALSAAKGSGYVVGHPTGRWCREALFFLVWSCPQAVAAANLCELAGIEDTSGVTP